MTMIYFWVHDTLNVKIKDYFVQLPTTHTQKRKSQKKKEIIYKCRNEFTTYETSGWKQLEF